MRPFWIPWSIFRLVRNQSASNSMKMIHRNSVTSVSQSMTTRLLLPPKVRASAAKLFLLFYFFRLFVLKLKCEFRCDCGSLELLDSFRSKIGVPLHFSTTRSDNPRNRVIFGFEIVRTFRPRILSKCRPTLDWFRPGSNQQRACPLSTADPVAQPGCGDRQIWDVEEATRPLGNLDTQKRSSTNFAGFILPLPSSNQPRLGSLRSRALGPRGAADGVRHLPHNDECRRSGTSRTDVWWVVCLQPRGGAAPWAKLRVGARNGAQHGDGAWWGAKSVWAKLLSDECS